MTLDSRLIDLWEVEVNGKEAGVAEITPSGKYFIYGIYCRYEIAADGLSMTIHPPRAPENFIRIGEPATSIVGEWTKNEGGDVENWHFLADGTYVGNWDDVDWFHGFYEATDIEYRTIEYRGDVTTENEIWYHHIDGTVHETKYIFIDENTFETRKTETNELVAIYHRKMS